MNTADQNLDPLLENAFKETFELGKESARLFEEQKKLDTLRTELRKELTEFWAAHPEEALTKIWKAYAKQEDELNAMVCEAIEKADQMSEIARDQISSDIEDLTTLRILRYRELLGTALLT